MHADIRIDQFGHFERVPQAEVMTYSRVMESRVSKAKAGDLHTMGQCIGDSLSSIASDTTLSDAERRRDIAKSLGEFIETVAGTMRLSDTIEKAAPGTGAELIEIAKARAAAARNPEAELVQKAVGNPLIAAALAMRDAAR